MQIYKKDFNTKQEAAKKIYKYLPHEGMCRRFVKKQEP